MRGRWEYASIWCLCVGTDAWVHMHAGDCGGGCRRGEGCGHIGTGASSYADLWCVVVPSGRLDCHDVGRPKWTRGGGGQTACRRRRQGRARQGTGLRVTSGGRCIECRGVCVRDEGQVGVCDHLVSVRGYACTDTRCSHTPTCPLISYAHPSTLETPTPRPHTNTGMHMYTLTHSLSHAHMHIE